MIQLIQIAYPHLKGKKYPEFQCFRSMHLRFPASKYNEPVRNGSFYAQTISHHRKLVAPLMVNDWAWVVTG